MDREFTRGHRLPVDEFDFDHIDFDHIDETFTDEYGARGADFTLAVDLRAGAMDGDDYYQGTIHSRFNVAAPVPPTRLTRLTPSNVTALRDTLTSADLARVDLGATSATFRMDVTTAHAVVVTAQHRAGVEHGTGGHPYRSLHAVLRKLVALAV